MENFDNKRFHKYKKKYINMPFTISNGDIRL